MQLTNQTHFGVVYPGHQVDGTAGAQKPIRRGLSYLPLDDMLQPPAEDIIGNFREVSDDDGEMRRLNPRRFPTTN